MRRTTPGSLPRGFLRPSSTVLGGRWRPRAVNTSDTGGYRLLAPQRLGDRRWVDRLRVGPRTTVVRRNSPGFLPSNPRGRRSRYRATDRNLRMHLGRPHPTKAPPRLELKKNWPQLPLRFLNTRAGCGAAALARRVARGAGFIPNGLPPVPFSEDRGGGTVLSSNGGCPSARRGRGSFDRGELFYLKRIVGQRTMQERGNTEVASKRDLNRAGRIQKGQWTKNGHSLPCNPLDPQGALGHSPRPRGIPRGAG